jgi:DegV family protein with EDD domain
VAVVSGPLAIVLDSACYLPEAVIARYGATVVPMTVTLDGEAFEESVTLDAPTFYERLRAGAKPATSQPPPGRFLAAYEAAAAAGAAEVVSIHIGSAYSGTVNSARVAAGMAPVPVHIIDTGQASFIEGLAAWEAMEALAAGATVAAAEAAAHRAAAEARNVFIVRGTELLREGGRLRHGEAAGPVPVLAAAAGAIRPIGSAATIDEAMVAMAAHVRAHLEAAPGAHFRIGIADGDAADLAAILEARVRALAPTAEVIPYTIGPAVGAHTGPGCTGAVTLARPRRA